MMKSKRKRMGARRRFGLFRTRRVTFNRDDRERIRWLLAGLVLGLLLLTVPSAVRQPCRYLLSGSLYYGGVIAVWVADQVRPS